MVCGGALRVAGRIGWFHFDSPNNLVNGQLSIAERVKYGNTQRVNPAMNDSAWKLLRCRGTISLN